MPPLVRSPAPVYSSPSSPGVRPAITTTTSKPALIAADGARCSAVTVMPRGGGRHDARRTGRRSSPGSENTRLDPTSPVRTLVVKSRLQLSRRSSRSCTCPGCSSTGASSSPFAPMTAIFCIVVRLIGSVLLSFLSRTIPSSAACSASWMWLMPMAGSVWSFFWIERVGVHRRERRLEAVAAGACRRGTGTSAPGSARSTSRAATPAARPTSPGSAAREVVSPGQLHIEAGVDGARHQRVGRALLGLQHAGALLPFIAHQSVSTKPWNPKSVRSMSVRCTLFCVDCAPVHRALYDGHDRRRRRRPGSSSEVARVDLAQRLLVHDGVRRSRGRSRCRWRRSAWRRRRRTAARRWTNALPRRPSRKQSSP